MPYKCFMVTKVNTQQVWVRTCDKKHGDDEPCNENGKYSTEVFDIVRQDNGEIVKTGQSYMSLSGVIGSMWLEDYVEPNMPKDAQDWSHLDEEGVKRVQNPDGSMPARHPSFIFAEGPQLTVMTPGGRWVIDSRASNCGSPYDYNHRCWIRHGEPPNITVDKNGATCSAGAGSIQCGSYHGFLQNGELT